MPSLSAQGSIAAVQTALHIYCAGRKKMIQKCKNLIAAGDFKWIFACNSEGI